MLHTGENFHESAFASAILAHDGEDFAAEEPQANVMQGANAKKALGNISDFEQWRRGLWHRQLGT
jgi:hypothetical protein